MSNRSGRLQEFRQFREQMNARILESGNLGVKRFFGLGSRALLRCDDCIAHHVIHRRDEGVTRDEFFEACNIGLVVGRSIVIPHFGRAVATLDEVEAP